MTIPIGQTVTVTHKDGTQQEVRVPRSCDKERLDHCYQCGTQEDIALYVRPPDWDRDYVQFRTYCHLHAVSMRRWGWGTVKK